MTPSDSPTGAPTLREALAEAIEVIKSWHGPEAWDLYYEHSPEMKRHRAALSAQAPDLSEVPFLIYFDDADCKPRIVIGEAAARHVFKEVSSSWNAHLFVKIESNSRDDTYASKNASLSAQAPPSETVHRALNVFHEYAESQARAGAQAPPARKSGLEQECDDADEILRAIGLDPDTYRTDGGFLNVPKIKAALGAGVTDEMVSRFLMWPLPKDFGPDCGISFDGRKDDEWNKNKTWPVGTNLFTADQAKAMLEYVLAGTPQAAIGAQAACPRCGFVPDGPCGFEPCLAGTPIDPSAGHPAQAVASRKPLTDEQETRVLNALYGWSTQDVPLTETIALLRAALAGSPDPSLPPPKEKP